MAYDGKLVSELGIKKYLQGYKAQSISNINIMASQTSYDKKWKECNFGCHGPTYRRLKPDLSFNEFLRHMDKISPVASGLIDGAHHSTFKQAEVLAAGVERTGEGLGVAGNSRVQEVGAENVAAYHLISGAVKKLVDVNLDLIDNPATQLIMAIINEYISLVPESMLESMVENGAIKIPDEIDKTFIYNAVAKGVVSYVDSSEIAISTEYLKTKGKHAVAKQIGKRLTIAIVAILVSKITKKIIQAPDTTWHMKRKITEFRKVGRGKSGGALILLLKANGWMGLIAKDSRKLKADCPKLWTHLRYKLNGADLLYFLVKEVMQEYIDRISLIEKSPTTYLLLMKSLIEAGKTEEIFFPR